MNQRYGGKYSPQKGQDRVSAHINKKLISRARIYRYFAIPIAIAGLLSIVDGSILSAILGLLSAGLIYGASHIVQEGLYAEGEYHSRAIARAPALPRKLIAAIMMGAGVACTGVMSGIDTAFAGLGVGIIATAGMIMSFGLDPMRSKGLSGVNQHEASRAAEAIERAQNMLDEIRAMATGIKDRRLTLDIENFALSAEEVFAQIEQNPGEYRATRRYLGVYLKGARDATSQFLNLPQTQQMGEPLEKYQSLVRELDAGFRQKSQLLLEDKRSELDVEIDVLRERLELEGIKISKEETL